MAPGSNIAHYRITSKLGEGGMGEVWRATDTKLNRDVAMKVLPDVFALDPDRMARFTREAQVLASLNHPNIAAIYVRPFPAADGGRWQISVGGGSYAFWSNNGHELFYETADFRIMVVDYKVEGASFVPGKPRLWSDKQLFFPGTMNLDLSPDGKRFAVLAQPENGGLERGSVHVVMLQNFFDELKRRIP